MVAIIEWHVQGSSFLVRELFSILLSQSTMSQVSPYWLPLPGPVLTAKSNSGMCEAHFASTTSRIQSGGEWRLQLSFVGPYAVLMRLRNREILEVVDSDNPKNCVTERQVIRLLANHGISLLNKENLELSVGLKLFDTEPQNVRVYQALFSDSDVLPWRPRI